MEIPDNTNDSNNISNSSSFNLNESNNSEFSSESNDFYSDSNNFDEDSNDSSNDLLNLNNKLNDYFLDNADEKEVMNYVKKLISKDIKQICSSKIYKKNSEQ